MNWRRYFFNLMKAENRRLNTQLGGAVEVPNSARLGMLREHHAYARVLCSLLNRWFNQPDHCAKALAAEDDDQLKYVADPTGSWFISLAVFWICWRLAVAGCMIYTLLAVT